MNITHYQLISSIHGYIEPAQVRALYDLAHAQAAPDSHILEIGAFKGKSTACLALPCVGTGTRVWSIDPFTRQPTAEYSDPIWEYSLDEWWANMRRIGVEHVVHPVVGLSEQAALDWDLPVDLLFIDGAHTYEGVLADFTNYFGWLKSGGVIAMHDVAEGLPWAGVLRVWNENVKPLCDGWCHVGSLAVGYKR
jgi:predicted O-methyltransferase YrrM